MVEAGGSIHHIDLTVGDLVRSTAGAGLEIGLVAARRARCRDSRRARFVPAVRAGYYAVFFADPDGMKLEYVFTPRWPA